MAGITGATIDQSLNPSNWLGFQTLDNAGNIIDSGTFGTGSNGLPNLPPLPAIGAAPSPSPTSQTYTPTAANPSGAPNPTATTGAASASSWSQWLVRGTIIVLGFIFIAVGLSMFRTPAAVEALKAVK